jgi:hypothetical protein
MEINPCTWRRSRNGWESEEDEEPFDDYDSAESDWYDETLDIQDYVNQDEYGGYKWVTVERRNKASMPIVSSDTLIESLVGR